jgi:transglycosylase-like protein with SLT domain
MVSRHLVLGCCLAAAFLPATRARASDHPAIDALVARHAKAHGVPESLVHRVIRRESNYNPRAHSRGNWGLMQIRHGTARAMGYAGSAAGLLDANTNLSYAVPYLANAYRVAGGNQDRAVALYARGYYYHAKRLGMLGSLRRGLPGGGADTETPLAQPAPTLGGWLQSLLVRPTEQPQPQPVAFMQPAEDQKPEASGARRRSKQAHAAAGRPADVASSDANAGGAAPKLRALTERAPVATEAIPAARAAAAAQAEPDADGTSSPPRLQSRRAIRAAALARKAAHADLRAADHPAQTGLKLPPRLMTER